MSSQGPLGSQSLHRRAASGASMGFVAGGQQSFPAKGDARTSESTGASRLSKLEGTPVATPTNLFGDASQGSGDGVARLGDGSQHARMMLARQNSGRLHKQSSSLSSAIADTGSLDTISEYTEEGTPDRAVLPPLPIRPTRPSSTSNKPFIEEAEPPNTQKLEGKPKAYVLEVPLAAPSLDTNGTYICEGSILTQQDSADFFPWIGKHVEDVLSDNVIKNGYADKSIVGNEFNSARALYSDFKQRGGPQILGSLFVGIFDKRRTLERITAVSTFKLPPRVTLTDTKREAWMRDLADYSIPLRRLSRTIPHGIRGRVLLDQCITKNVPVARAIWLTRCVGANEIRAFKRRGTGGSLAVSGELKWIKDWTAAIHQFVDSIIAQCGSQGWRTKMDYCVRLVAHLYSEQLLDQEYFLDWLLTSTNTSTVDSLPIWMLILNIFVGELTRSRRTGRRLTDVLTGKLHQLLVENHEIYKPLVDRLSSVLATLLVQDAQNFVDPPAWSERSALLEEAMSKQRAETRDIFTDLTNRNSALWRKNTDGMKSKQMLARLEVVRTLDRCSRQVNIDEAMKAFNKSALPADQILGILLDWATTEYRVGVHRVYIAVRIIRNWRKQGLEVDYPILSHASSFKRSSNSEKLLFLILSELIRSRDFSAARFMQWLIARGGLGEQSKSDFAFRLLVQMPSGSLTRQLRNLRKVLLTGTQHTLDEEASQVKSAKAAVDQALGDTEEPTASAMDSVVFQNLSRTVQSETALHVRHIVRTRFSEVKEHIPLTRKRKANGEPEIAQDSKTGINATHLGRARAMLEAMGDFSILADVLKLTASSDDPLVLASVADTLNFHYETFKAMGALSDIFNSLNNRFKALKAAFVSEKALLTSFLSLATRMENKKDVVQLFTSLLSTCEHRAAVSAYSPVSDHMAELLQSEDSEFLDEVEQQLASGTSMDLHTMTRMFESVISRIVESWSASPEKVTKLSNLLSRLRSFGKTDFDHLIVAWLKNLLSLSDRPSLMKAVSPLIVSDCISLESATACIADFLDNKSDAAAESSKPRVALEGFQLLFDKTQPGDVMSFEVYRYRLLQHLSILKDPIHALSSIRRAIQFGAAINLDDISQCAPATDHLKQCMVSSMKDVKETFVAPILQLGSSNTSNMIRLLTGPWDNSIDTHRPVIEEIAQVLQDADDFSLPFCQLRLRLSLDEQTAKPDGSTRPVSAATLFGAIDAAISRGNTAWTDLISFFSPQTMAQIRHYAEERLMLALTNSESAEDAAGSVPDSAQSKNPERIAERCLAIIEATSLEHASASSAQLIPAITRKLISTYNQIADAAAPRLEDTAALESVVPPATKFWMSTLLRLLVLNLPKEVPRAQQSDITRLLLVLCSYLQHPVFSATSAPSSTPATATTSTASSTPLSTFIFDAACLILDRLDTSAYAIALKLLSDVNSPLVPQIKYLFALSPSKLSHDLSWLQAIVLTNPRTSGATPSASGSGFMGNTAPASAQNQAAASSSASSSQRKVIPYNVRWWEMLPEPAPIIGDNDTCISLHLFDARKIRRAL